MDRPLALPVANLVSVHCPGHYLKRSGCSSNNASPSAGWSMPEKPLQMPTDVRSLLAAAHANCNSIVWMLSGDGREYETCVERKFSMDNYKPHRSGRGRIYR